MPTRPRTHTREAGPDGNAFAATVSRRRALRTAALSAVGVSFASMVGLAGCGTAVKPGAKTGGTKAKVTIHVGLYQSASQSQWKAITSYAFPLFMKKNPDINLVWVPEPPTSNLMQKVVTMYAAHTAPDIIQDCCSDLPTYASKGMLLDLTSYIKADWPQNWESDFLPSQLGAEVMTQPYHAGRFALPTYCGTMGMFYNVDRFKQLKLGTPDATWTFTDWANAMNRLNNPSHKQFGGLIPWTPDDRFAANLLAPFGARLVDAAKPTTAAVNTKQGLAAVTWLYDLFYTSKSVIPWNAAHWGSPSFPGLPEEGIFAQQLAAVMGEGSWMIERVAQAVGTKFKWAIAVPPKGPVKRSTLSTTDGYAILKTTKHPAEAWKVLSWLAGTEFGKILVEKAFLQPSRKSLIPYFVKYAETSNPILKSVNLAALTDGLTKNWATPEQLFTYEAQALVAYKAVMSESLYSLKPTLSPQQIVTQLATQIDASQTKAASGG